MKRLAFASLLVCMIAALWIPQTDAAGPDPAFAPGQVVIQFREGATAAQQQATRGRVRAVQRQVLRRQGTGLARLELATLPAGSNVQAAIATLQGDPAVEFAEPNWLYTTGPVTPSAVANDRGYQNGSHWNLYGDKTTPYANQFGSQAGKRGRPTVPGARRSTSG